MLTRVGVPMLLIFALFFPQPGRAGTLHEAAKTGRIDAVKGLLDQGADLAALDDDGETPLTAAALAGQTATVKLLVARGADIKGRNKGGFTALHAAAYTGHVGIVEFAIDRGVEIDDQDNKAKITALHAAVERDHLDVVKLLIDRGARIDLKELNGWSPVTRGTFKRRKEAVKLLRLHGAECDPPTRIGVASHRFCMNPGG